MLFKFKYPEQETEAQRLFPLLKKVKVERENICTNSHEKEDFQETLCSVIKCINRRCGESLLCEHSVQIDRCETIEDKDHTFDATTVIQQITEILYMNKVLDLKDKETVDQYLEKRKVLDSITANSKREKERLLRGGFSAEIEEQYYEAIHGVYDSTNFKHRSMLYYLKYQLYLEAQIIKKALLERLELII